MKRIALHLLLWIGCVHASAQFPNVEFTLDNGISDVTLRNLSTLPSSAVGLSTSKGSARLRNDGKLTISATKKEGLGSNSWTLWPHNENADLYFYSNSNTLKGMIDSETGEYRPAGVQMKHYSGSSFLNSKFESAWRQSYSMRSNYEHPGRLKIDLDLPNGAIVDSIHVFDADVDADRNLDIEIKIYSRPYHRIPPNTLLTANYTSYGSDNGLVRRTLIPTEPFVIEKMTHSYNMSVKMDWDGPAYPTGYHGQEPPNLRFYGANVFFHFEM